MGRPSAARATSAPLSTRPQTTCAIEFNDVGALERALAREDIAVVLAEPAMTNMGIVLPDRGYHEALRSLTREHGTLLIIDETHTFSAGPGGCTAEWGLDPDLLTIGKAIGSGIPSGALGLSERLAETMMDQPGADYEDTGGVGGTLAGNALSLAAMRVTLEKVLTAEAYTHAIPLAGRFADGVRDAVAQHGLGWNVTQLGCRAEYRFQPRARAQRHRGARRGRPRTRALPAPARAQPRRAAHAVPQHGADGADHHRGGCRPPQRGLRGGRRDTRVGPTRLLRNSKLWLTGVPCSGPVFYLSYIAAELRRRKGRTLLTALGLAVGVGLVVTVTALSSGLDDAQQKVLKPLTGVGTDMSVTRPLKLSGNGGFAGLTQKERDQLRKENGPVRIGLANRGKPGTHFSDDNFIAAGQLSFPESEVAKIAELNGAKDAAGGLTLTALHIEGTVPKQSATPQVFGAPPGSSSGTPGPPRNIDAQPMTVTGVDVSRPTLGAIAPSQLTTGSFLHSGSAREACSTRATHGARTCTWAIRSRSRARSSRSSAWRAHRSGDRRRTCT